MRKINRVSGFSTHLPNLTSVVELKGADLIFGCHIGAAEQERVLKLLATKITEKNWSLKKNQNSAPSVARRRQCDIRINATPVSDQSTTTSDAV